jgi:hypothetical protein
LNNLRVTYKSTKPTVKSGGCTGNSTISFTGRKCSLTAKINLFSRGEALKRYTASGVVVGE